MNQQVGESCLIFAHMDELPVCQTSLSNQSVKDVNAHRFVAWLAFGNFGQTVLVENGNAFPTNVD